MPALREENRQVALILQNLLGTSPIYPTGVNLTNAHALHVALVDTNGDQVASFGGGTQYADGAARGTATGTLLMVDDGTLIQSLSGDSSGRLNINNISGTITLPTLAATSTKQSDGSQKTQLVDGSGNVIGATTNALDINIKSGNPTTLTTVSTVTNLAQMNGAAITMGNGISGTGVQRVTIASDSTGQVTLAAGSNTIGALTANQSVNNTQIGGNTISTGVGATGNGTQRVVVANDAGRTLVSKGGSAGSSGDNTLVVAGTNRLKVYAFSLSTVSTTAVTCIFQSGASGTELWRVVLQTPASVAGGANLVVQPPAWLFATASATLLNLNLSGAVTVHWSVSYFDEA